MTDFDNDYDSESFDDPEDSGTVQAMRQRIKQLEKQGKAFNEANARANAAERKALFFEAGLDPTDPRAKYFVKGYDGEMTVDEIKAEASEAGLIGDFKPADIIPAEEKAALSRVDETAKSAESADEDFASKIALATSEDEVLAILRESGSPLSTDYS